MTFGSFRSAFSRRKHDDFVQLGPSNRIFGVLGMVLMAAATLYPYIYSDIADTFLGERHWFTGLRWGVASLATYCLFTRKLAWWEYIALLLIIAGLMGGYTINLSARQPLTLVDLVLRIGIGIFVLRLLFRPTPHEDQHNVRALEQENQQLRDEIALLRGEKQL